jgi:MATE family multidrug resistance protein
MNKRDLQILKIALPAIVTNITVPLLGLVDTAIVGHMGAAVYIGAIAVGSMMFNLVYWLFGFLRMSTSGLTAQARGRRDFREMSRQLSQSVLVALVVSVVLLLLQWPLYQLLLWLIGPTADVRPLVKVYFRIVIWGAPATLTLYALSGWYIGMQNTRTPMVISIIQNVVNIVASLFFVYSVGMKVSGVAFGTVIAQYAGLLVGVVFLKRYYWRHLENHGNWFLIFDRIKKSAPVIISSQFSISGALFLRTLCLVAVNLYFTSAGARQGAEILAVNTLLMQLYLLFSYVMDGFAYAGEALGGKFWGAKDVRAFKSVVRHLFLWGALMTALFTAIYVFGGMPFLRLLTDNRHVVAASEGYVWWAYLIPVAGVAAFIWDGLYIGTTHIRGMLISSAIAAIAFFATAIYLMPYFGNQALWLAMIVFLAMRGIVQTYLALSFELRLSR